MENAVQALIMAASVLLLIIALSVSISSLTSLKAQVQDIFLERDQVDLTTYTITDQNGKKVINYANYIKSDSNLDVRTVNAETVISTIERMRKEEYTIYIKIKNAIPADFRNNFGALITKLGDENQKYGNAQLINKQDEIIKLDLTNQRLIFYNNERDENGNLRIKQKLNENLISKLYSLLKQNTNGKENEFKEYIGIFQYKTSQGVSEANKQTYKIITFVQQ